MSHEKAAPLTEVSAMDPALAALLMELWDAVNESFGDSPASALLPDTTREVLRGLNEAHRGELERWARERVK